MINPVEKRIPYGRPRFRRGDQDWWCRPACRWIEESR